MAGLLPIQSDALWLTAPIGESPPASLADYQKKGTQGRSNAGAIKNAPSTAQFTKLFLLEQMLRRAA
jgi:hypothetical protein